MCGISFTLEKQCQFFKKKAPFQGHVSQSSTIFEKSKMTQTAQTYSSKPKWEYVCTVWYGNVTNIKEKISESKNNYTCTGAVRYISRLRKAVWKKTKTFLKVEPLIVGELHTKNGLKTFSYSQKASAKFIYSY